MPKAVGPRENPYQFVDREADMGYAKSLVALAGASLYPLIPNSPWAQAVKGTLEQSYRSNPLGSSQIRLNEHYAAFVSAFNSVYR